MTTPVVLITGSLTGIARATALAYAKTGAKIVVSGRHDDKGAAPVAELRAAGAEAEFVRADVRHDDDVRNLVDKTVARFGRLDIAAGTEGKPEPAIDQTAESYAATFDTNVLGTILSMKHELRVMQAQGSGSIVNISSTYGHGVHLCCEQACGRRPDQVGGAGSRRLRHPDQRRGPGADRHQNAGPLHRRGGRQGLSGHAEPDEADRPARRDRTRHPLRSLGRRQLPDKSHPDGRWRQVGRLIPRRGAEGRAQARPAPAAKKSLKDIRPCHPN
jgi:hypothetical protein